MDDIAMLLALGSPWRPHWSCCTAAEWGVTWVENEKEELSMINWVISKVML